MAERQQRLSKAPDICPVCGEDVPRDALACPGCGADHNSGWREGAETYDGLDLPDEFDYDDFVGRQFGTSPRQSGISAIWWITAMVLLALTLLYLLAGR